MPRLDNLFMVLLDYCANSIQFFRRKAAVSTQCDRFEPKLAGHSSPLDMYVHGFIAVKAIEKEAIRTRNYFDRWHCINRYFVVLFTVNSISA